MTMVLATWILGLALAAASAPAVPPPTKPATPVAQNYAPKPALWLLQDADTKLYLFGTIHMLPPGFRWRTAAFDKVVGAADELVVETYTPEGEPPAGMDAIFTDYFLAADAKPIAERVPADKREALSRALGDMENMPVGAFDVLQTWAVAFMLGMDQIFEDMGAENPKDAPGVEDQLETVFNGDKRPIGSIEDGDAVIRRFFGHMSGLPEAEQAELLVDAVEADRANGGEVDDLQDLHDWAGGRPEKLALKAGEDFPRAMYDMLLVERNAAWTGWLAERLEKPGTVLVAVGAGHLAGADSVQAMLAKRGMTVTRVQ